MSAAMEPPLMVGLQVDAGNPFKLNFIMDKGEKALSQEEQKQEFLKIVKYFLTSLATPNPDMWVNLSPYEKDRIIPDNFSKTEMGRDLLAQDYLLKQLSSSLTDPSSELGKKFWDGIYARAYEKFGTTDVPTDMFNKVWIMPDKAVVYEKDNTAYVLESHLKVMTEADYLAQSKNAESSGRLNDPKVGIVPEVMREVIIPALEKEVNEGASFAPLRQVYSGMLLATYFKRVLRQGILGQVYVDKNKVAGVDLESSSQEKEKIYKQYLEAFQKGVFNYIKEDVDPVTRELIPRKYFSGGTMPLRDEDLAQTSVVTSAGAAKWRKLRNGSRAVKASVVLRAAPAISGRSTVSAAEKSEYADITDFLTPVGQNIFLVPGVFVSALHDVFSSAEVKKSDVRFSEKDQGSVDYDRLIAFFQAHQEDETAGRMYRFFLTGDPEVTRKRQLELGNFLDGIRGGKKGFVLLNENTLLDGMGSESRQLFSASFALFMNEISGDEDALIRLVFQGMLGVQLPQMDGLVKSFIERFFKGELSEERMFFIPFIFPSALKSNELESFKQQIAMIKMNMGKFLPFGVLQGHLPDKVLQQKIVPFKDTEILPFMLTSLFRRGWDGQPTLYVRVMKTYESLRQSTVAHLRAQHADEVKVNALNGLLISHRNKSLRILQGMHLLAPDFNYEKEVAKDSAMREDASSRTMPVQNDLTPGGIDLNDRQLDLQVKRDGKGMPLPIGLQDPAMRDVAGLVPVIIDMVPFEGSLPGSAMLFREHDRI
ncbi:MAG: hypothetical protein HQL22_01290 [Candidatus Omnitrophica bacterium]|nr:hypothetical protein [Candidatus Omnitrophota bacterium]